MKPGPVKQFDPDVALEAAMGVFWDRGYEAASLTELTQAMGIGKKSLYDTFGNKRALFLQALELYSTTRFEAIRTRLLEQGSPRKNLEALLLEWKRMHCQVGSRGCLIGTNIADFDEQDEQVAAILNKKLEELEEAFAQTLKNAQKLGEVSPDMKTREVARMLVCLGQGIALVGRIQCSEKMIEGAYRTALNLLRQP